MKRMICFFVAVFFFLAVSFALSTGLEDIGNLGDLSQKIEKVLGGKNGSALKLALSDKDLGNLFADGIDKKYGISNDSQALIRLKQVAARILSKNGIQGKYDFQVLASDTFNACSILGGHIRFYEGMLRDTTNNDAELAFVIAHEISHNELGHNKETAKNFKIENAAELFNISQNLPDLLKSGVKAVLAKRNRKLETQADANALVLMTKAGYSPKGAIALCRRIEAEHKIESQRNGNGGNNIVGLRYDLIFATHPEPEKRVAMAEDFYFQQKYGTTFQEVLGTSTSRITANNPDNAETHRLPIIVAHPGQWDSYLTLTDRVIGIGIFNPLSVLKEKDEVAFYLNTLNQGRGVCVTDDNDSHFRNSVATADYGHTFIQSSTTGKDDLIAAMRNGRTYASFDGTRIKNETFRMGYDYPQVRKVALKFSLALGKLAPLSPKVKVFRNNQGIAELKPDRSNGQLSYSFTDNVKAGDYWYVLYVPKILLTSPITVAVTGNKSDGTNFTSTVPWQKGIVHCHSDHSDGSARLQKIADSCKKDGLNFVFMTDHDDCFGVNVNHSKLTHNHSPNNPYANYVSECKALPGMIPGVEWALRDINQKNHVLILDVENPIAYSVMSDEEFFLGKGNYSNRVLIIKGPFHLGDDFPNTEIIKDATFNYGKVDATVKLRIKGSPFKDPILWINRHEIGRVITTDNKWHWFEFRVPAEYLKNGQNLFHIEFYIPDRFHTFDDCEVADVWIYR